MSKFPLVTIMIPTYNQEKFICDTIQSALDQDYPNIEIIISDDQSKDRTSEIVKKIADANPIVKYCYNNINLGRVGNYRKNLYDYSKGKYVLNLDGDDLLIDKSFVSNAINFFATSDEINLVVACKQYNLLNGLVEKKHKIDSLITEISGVDFVLDIFYKYEFSHLTTVYKRELAIQNDFYRTNIISSDVESLLRVAILGKVVIYNKIVGQWNPTGDNESANQSFKNSLDNLIWIKSVYNELKKHRSHIQCAIWRIKMKYVYSNPLLLAIRGQRGVSFKQLFLLIDHKILIISLFRLGTVCCRSLFRKLSLATHKLV